MWKDEFTMEQLRDLYLVPYQEKYPQPGIYNYADSVTKIIASEEDYGAN
jgi:hypothetical protein